MKTQFIFGLSCSLTSAMMVFVMLVSYQAWADNDNNPATEDIPRTFQYSGDLDWDGVPYDGPVDMRFALYGAPDSPDILWTEDHTIIARRGRFSAELGTQMPITETIYDAGALFLGVEVQRPEDEAFVLLGNRQKINPVPYALVTTNAANLDIAGDINVTGNIERGSN